MSELLLLPHAFWYAVLFVLGLVVGSFLNVVIYRLPRGESIVLPASHCGSCGVAIKPYDNIPLASYLVLGGRCRACRVRISPRYPAVEALTGLLFAAAFWAHPYVDLGLAADCVFLALLVPLVFIDADHMILPAAITHPGLVFALVARGLVPNLYGFSIEPFGFGAMIGFADGPDWYASLAGAAFGATLGGGSLLLLGWLWWKLRGQWGMGLGDVSMMCFVGAYLGWELTILSIVLASFVGSVVGVWAVLSRGGDLKEQIPFGVFLGAGSALSLLAGRYVIATYLEITNLG